MNLKDFVPDKKSLLCSDHFEKACFRKTGRLSCNLSLKDNAVPTIFTKPLTKGEILRAFLCILHFTFQI